ncbi:lipopolysaccharide biosynthesis protein [Stenotrophomonas sp.]|uniref:lipopolysaccharide biosynthesis protein n=1 Tax=Stenotrophomonas sp. TaxID=69392 RepID=UPI0028B181BA|nr:lipopolysaccharide biosynthesis protein [Stenotrophomonas sp.]
MMAGRFVGSTLRTTVVLGCRVLVQAASLVLLARMLGADQFGMFAASAALGAIAIGFATLGTHLTLLRDLSRDEAAGQLQKTVCTTFVGSAVMTCVFVGAALLLISPPVEVIIAIGFADVIVQPLLQVLSVPHHARGRPALAQVLMILPMLLRAIWIAVLSVWSGGAELHWFLVGYVASSLIALLVAVLALPTLEKRPWRWGLIPRSRLGENSGYALLSATAIAPGEIDKALAARFLDPADAGIYSATTRVAAAAVMPVTALMLALIPYLYRGDAAIRGNRLVVVALVAGYGALAGVVLSIAGPALEVLFGPTFTGLSAGISIFAWVLPAMCLRVVASNLLMTQEQPWVRAGVELAGVGLLIVAAAVLSQLKIANAMYLATAACEYSMAIAGWLMVLRRERIKPVAA